METQGNEIAEFYYGLENIQTFDAWYKSYKNLFEGS